MKVTSEVRFEKYLKSGSGRAFAKRHVGATFADTCEPVPYAEHAGDAGDRRIAHGWRSPQLRGFESDNAYLRK